MKFDALTTKVKGATISEALITIAITVIVVGISFAVLLLVKLQMRGMQGYYKEHLEVNQAQQILSADFFKADKVIADKTGFTLTTLNDQEINYNLKDSTLLRNQDTLLKNCESLLFYHKGLPANSSKVDAIKVVLIGKPNDYLFAAYKETTLSRIQVYGVSN